jgi:trk system potassium uptake protein TrkH
MPTLKIIHFNTIIKVVGVLFILVGVLMATSLPFSLYFHEGDFFSLLSSAIISITLGGIMWYLTKDKSGNVQKRDGYLIVAIGWISIILISTLPYMLSGTFSSFTDAIFESTSGLTTTGASALTDIEAVSKGVLYWRSLTQWIGGMGIIVLTVAIFPLLGFGGIELFAAEAPGPTSDKIHPRIKETAKKLWLVYVGLTAALMIILWINGMTFYDAVNHAFTTLATGGFSTKNASIAHYNTPGIQYPLIIFMFLAGTNFGMTYLALKGKFKAVWRNDEFKLYLISFLLLGFFSYFMILEVTDIHFEQAFRDAFFQVISIMTTTGFVSADYTSWSIPLTFIFFLLLFVGGSAGSTAGGIKMVRHWVLWENSTLELKRLLHPRAIIKPKFNGQFVPNKTVNHIVVFFVTYMSVFGIGAIVLTFLGVDFMTAIGAAATSIGNVGPGIGKVGPVDNFAHFSPAIKIVLSFLMLLGRLELFSILILFSPYFWRTN